MLLSLRPRFFSLTQLAQSHPPLHMLRRYRLATALVAALAATAVLRPADALGAAKKKAAAAAGHKEDAVLVCGRRRWMGIGEKAATDTSGRE